MFESEPKFHLYEDSFGNTVITPDCTVENIMEWLASQNALEDAMFFGQEIIDGRRISTTSVED